MFLCLIMLDTGEKTTAELYVCRGCDAIVWKFRIANLKASCTSSNILPLSVTYAFRQIKKY